MYYWKLWVLPRRYELLETGVAKLLDLCKTLMLDEVRREPQADKADQLPRPSIVASTDVSPMFDTLFRIWHPNSKVDHLLDICRLANGTQEIRAFFDKFEAKYPHNKRTYPRTRANINKGHS
jgi:hypothetical protein